MKQQQFIQCPECGTVELATIDHSTVPFSTWIHQCTKCEYYIQESEWDAIPALSIRQPWAWLITNGYKNIENRNTLKNFRGLFLIHASQQTDWKAFHAHMDKAMPNQGIYMPQEKIQTGGIIGYATITDCVQKSDSPWFVGPNGFVIEKPHPLPFTPCKGALGFFQPKIFTK